MNLRPLPAVVAAGAVAALLTGVVATPAAAGPNDFLLRHYAEVNQPVCLDGAATGAPWLGVCGLHSGYENWHTDGSHLVDGSGSCLDVGDDRTVYLNTCHANDAYQAWEMDGGQVINDHFRDIGQGGCLDANGLVSYSVYLNPCNGTDFQKWITQAPEPI